MLEKLSVRVIAMIVAALALVIGISLFIHSCDVRRSKAAQSRVERSQAQAASNSAQDAIATVANADAAAGASEDLTRSNEKEIRNAEGSNAGVNPAARDAGLRSLCRRAAYRDDQRCKLLKPAP
jgi:hypothetical protein